MLLLEDKSSQGQELNTQSHVPTPSSEDLEAPSSAVQVKEESGRSPTAPQPSLKEEPAWTIPTLKILSAPANVQTWYPDAPASGRCFNFRTPIGTSKCEASCDDRCEASSSPPPDQNMDTFHRQAGKKLEAPDLEEPDQASPENEFRTSQYKSLFGDDADSPSSELNDDADGIFDTPIRNAHDMPAQCSPFTPPSTYASRGTWLGDDESSPCKARPSRPGPEPLQEVNDGTESGIRGRKMLRPVWRIRSKSSTLSAGSCTPASRSCSTQSTTRRVEENDGQTSFKLEVEEKPQNNHGTLPAATLVPTGPPAQPRASSHRLKPADILLSIFGSNVLDRIQQDTVRQDQRQCVASTKSSSRCSRPLKHNLGAVQECLHDIQESLTLESCCEALSSVIERYFCARSHCDIAKRAADWMLEHHGTAFIHEILEETNGSDSIKTSNDIVPRLFSTQTSDLIPSKAKKNMVSPSIYNFNFSAGKSVTSRLHHVGHPRDFKEWKPPGVAKLSVSHALITEIIKPLNRREEKSGYLYIYSVSGEFGFRKIGVAANVKERLRRTVSQCKHDATPVDPPTDQKTIVKHVYRLEKLVHTELKEMRHQVTSCNCPRNQKHTEWFKVDDRHASAVVQRWTDWLKTDPYEDRDGTWVLKDTHIQFGLGKLCTPFVSPGIERTPGQKPKRKYDGKRWKK